MNAIAIIAIGSLTGVMKGEELLRSRGIPAKTVRLSPGRTKKGCGYGLEIGEGALPAALRLLRAAGISTGEVLR